MMRSHDLKNKVWLPAFVFQPLYLSRPVVFFHANIVDYVIDYVNYFLKHATMSNYFA